MIEFGLIVDIDAPKGMVKVFVPETGNTTEFIPFMRRFSMGNSECFPIKINELVLVGQTDSERWFVLGSCPNDEDRPYTGTTANKLGVKLSDGCLIEYDIAASKLTVNTSGSVSVTGATKVEINSMGEVDITAAELRVTAPVINLNGAVTVVGALVASAGLSVSGGDGIETTGDVVAGGVSVVNHLHTNVQTGSGVSGPPTPIP